MFKKDYKKDYDKELIKIRKSIPKEYNQLKIFDYLNDKDISQLFTITTRGDGKTYNTLYACAMLSKDLDFCTGIIVRHDELKTPMMLQIEDIYFSFKDFDEKKVSITKNIDITQIIYKNKLAFVLFDLNSANDLKHYRSILSKINLFFYDEFLALNGEYADNEFLKWKYIFETADKGTPITEGMKYTNNKRKVLFAGNPVDWGSQFLMEYDLYHVLETQKMNTIRKYKTFAIERRRNNKSQVNSNSDMFPNEAESVTGEFAYNDWKIKKNSGTTVPIIVKIREGFIYIFNEKTPILSVKSDAESYSFNTELYDNTDDSTYCDENYYRISFYKKYSKGFYYFENEYSKNVILKNYKELNISKIIRKSISQNHPDEEKIYKISKEEETKKLLFRQYFG